MTFTFFAIMAAINILFLGVGFFFGAKWGIEMTLKGHDKFRQLHRDFTEMASRHKSENISEPTPKETKTDLFDEPKK